MSYAESVSERIERIRRDLKWHTPAGASEPCECDHCFLLASYDDCEAQADSLQGQVNDLIHELA